VARHSRCRAAGCRKRPQVARLVGVDTPYGRAVLRLCDQHFTAWVSGAHVPFKPWAPPGQELKHSVEYLITEIEEPPA
jgi:hypothetical protein